MRTIALVCLLAVLCLCGTPASAQIPDISQFGFEFVLEIYGITIQRVLSAPEGSLILQTLHEDFRADIFLDRIIAEANRRWSPNIRLVAQIRVALRAGATWSHVTNATLAMRAVPCVTLDDQGRVVVTIVPVPDTLLVTADPPGDALVEMMVRQAAGQIAERLQATLVYEGLDTLARARLPDSLPLQASAYELGYTWVLQVYAPLYTGIAPPPELFRIGNAFTLVLSGEMVQRLATYALSTGLIPGRMTEQGLIDPQGPITILAVDVELEPCVLVLNWQGLGPGNRPVAVQWRMCFMQAPEDVLLRLSRVAVDGVPRVIPPEAEYINPINELIRRIATGPPPPADEVLDTPLGRMRLAVGEIWPEGVVVAGRAY